MASTVVTEDGKTLQQVPCCMCGSMILPNEACLCVVCLQRETSLQNEKEDVNELIQCKSCNKWCSHIGKDTWVYHELESAGLLGLCVKKLGSISKAKILDAAWIWTEPHSRRLKLYVDIEKAVLDGKMKVQQRVVAEFVLKSKHCSDCIRSESDHSWGAMIQLRQRNNHQRSLVVLESQLTKGGMHNLMIGVENSKQGMDFYFKQKNQAEKVVNFISTHLPTKSKFSKKHISTDPRTGKTRFELTYAVDIVPLGRGDLLLMPTNLNAKNSSAGELVVVSKVASSIHLMNPITMKRDELTASRYFAKEKVIRTLMSPPELVRFMILDIEPVDDTKKSVEGVDDAKSYGIKEAGGLLADAEVARETDMGCNDLTYRVRTHLGHLLKPGNMALGYDMVRYASSAGIEANSWLQHLSKGRDRSSTIDVPEVILVKKDYDDDQKKMPSSKRKKIKQHKKQTQEESVIVNNEADESETGSDSIFAFADTQVDATQLDVVEEGDEDVPSDLDEYSDDDLADEDEGDLEGLFDHLIDRNPIGETSNDDGR